MSTTYLPIPASEVPDAVRWDVPERNQGQIVEAAYAAWPPRGDEAGDGDAYMLITDRSAGVDDPSREVYYRALTTREAAVWAVLDSERAFLVGDADPLSVVTEWIEAGFTSAKVRDWAIKARCFRAAAAQNLRDHYGMSAADAATVTGPDVGTGEYSDTIGCKVANGDLYSHRAKAALA